MHELSLMRNIVDIVGQHAEGRPVSRIRLQLGELSAVMPEALQFSFEAIRAGTLLDGAELEILAVPGRARCLSCGAEYPMPACGARCSCGSMRYQLLAGDELKVVEIEVN